MNTDKELKDLVRDRYGKIASQDKAVNAASCCGATACGTEVYNIMTDDYTGLAGYAEDADLGLGCGLPTAFAQIKPGDTVIDLGSGAGNDCFVARHETGPTGKVIGIDFTPSMIAKARANADKLGFNNVEFREGDIDAMPVGDETADVLVSNCVLNLVPNKQKVIAEMHRVLKSGGHFSVSDIVLQGQLPDALRHDAEMYAGCVAGAIQQSDYLRFIEEAGFKNITVQKTKPIVIPDDLLEKYLTPAEMTDFKTGTTGIFSITVYGERPPAPQRGVQETPKKKLAMADIQAGANCCGPNCC